MATEELPKCGICQEPMVLLKQTTENKKTPIYVCNIGKEKSKMPCDGFVFEISLKNS